MDASGKLERNAPVLYSTFAGRREADQVLGAKVIFKSIDSFRQLLRSVAEELPSSGLIGDLVQEVEIRELFVRMLRVHRLLFGWLT